MKKGYSLVNETEDHFEVHDGKKQFAIAKHYVSNHIQNQIKNMPKYYQGAVVGAEEPVKEEESLFDKAKKGADLLASGAKSVINAGHEDYLAKKAAEAEPIAAPREPAEILEAPVVQATTPELAQTPAVAPVAQPNPVSGLMAQEQSATNQQIQGVNKVAEVQGNIANQQAALADKLYSPEKVQEAQDKVAKLEEQRQVIADQNEKLYQAAFDNKIDPKRVWNNMSTGNKVLSTISIILGGLGSGGNAANNAAMNVLNKQVDDDIRAQMAAGDNARNLYQINLQKYRDVGSAIEATKSQLSSVIQGQIGAVAAKNGSDMAKAQATQMIGQLKAQQVKNNLSVLETYGKMPQRVEGDSMAAKVSRLPKEQQDNAIKELGVYEASKAASQQFKSIFNESAVLNSLGNKLLNPIQTANKLKALKARLYPIARKIAGPGTFSDTDAGNLIDPLLSSWSNNKKTNQEILSGVLQTLESLREENTPTLRLHNLIPNTAALDFKKR
jgi:hypothetical protein